MDDIILNALVADVQSRFLLPPGPERVVLADSDDQDEMGVKVTERAYELGGFHRFGSIGDGNCVFRSHSQSIVGHQNWHPDFRQAVISLMRLFPFRYNIRHNFNTLDYLKYLAEKEHCGEPVGWDVELAVSDLLQARIIRTNAVGSTMISETVPYNGQVFYEINLASIPWHVDTLAREHLYTNQLEE